MNDEQLIDAAIDASCLVIQTELKQTDGDVAGIFFGGREDIRVILLAYIKRERSSALYKIALRLYEAGGKTAVTEWGDRMGLRFSRCEPCEDDTPVIDDGDESCCAVCGTDLKNKEPGALV